jgi:hypothetical protein
VFESSLRGGGRSGSHLHGELYHMLMRQSNLPDENPVVQAAYAAMDMSGWRSMEKHGDFAYGEKTWFLAL